MNERKIHWRSLERERGGVRRGPSVQTPEAFVGRAGVTGVPPGRAGGWGSCGQAGGRAGGAGNRGGGQYRRLPAPLPPGTPARLVESPGPALETSFFFFFLPWKLLWGLPTRVCAGSLPATLPKQSFLGSPAMFALDASTRTPNSWLLSAGRVPEEGRRDPCTLPRPTAPGVSPTREGLRAVP